MHGWHTVALLVCLSTLLSAQTEPTTLKTEAVSAFLWDDTSPSAFSSETIDPVTGAPIHRLTHAGVEVSSTAYFEVIRSGMSGEFLVFTVMIANNTARDLVIGKAGVIIDGRLTMPLSPYSRLPKPNKELHESAAGILPSQCLQRTRLQSETLLDPSPTPIPMTVSVNTARVLIFLAKDPRPYSLLCSVKGCFPKGVMRFYITLSSTDYVFVWPGQSLTACGQ